MSDNTGSATAGNPGATASGTEGATTTTTTTPPAANAPWYGTIEDAELRGFVELKGWNDPASAIQSYRNLEKLQGVPPERLLKLPEQGDAAGWGEIHKKLGFAAPETAADYGLDKIEGFDPQFIEGAQKALHARGVPKDMAVAVMQDIAAQLGDIETTVETQRQAAFDSDLAKLRTEWGGNFDALTELGKRAAAEFMPKSGLEQGDLDAIRDTIGQAKFNKLWAGIGSSMGEASFHEGGGPAVPGAMTPDAALARRNQMVADQDFIARYQRGEARAVQEWQRVNETLAHSAASTGVVR